VSHIRQSRRLPGCHLVRMQLESAGQLCQRALAANCRHPFPPRSPACPLTPPRRVNGYAKSTKINFRWLKCSQSPSLSRREGQQDVVPQARFTCTHSRKPGGLVRLPSSLCRFPWTPRARFPQGIVRTDREEYRQILRASGTSPISRSVSADHLVQAACVADATTRSWSVPTPSPGSGGRRGRRPN